MRRRRTLCDHVDANTGTPGFSWADALVDCKKSAARVHAASGNAQVLHLPERGVVGNSHMMMMDKNNLQVADLLLQWISSNAKK